MLDRVAYSSSVSPILVFILIRSK